MKRGVGLSIVSVTLLSFSCGKTGTSASDDDAASGGTAMTAAPAAGSSGKGASAGGGQSGAGGATAGSSAQSGASGGGNASAAGGDGGHAGTTLSAGAGGTTASGGQAGDGETAGLSGTGSGAASLTMFVMFDRSWSMNQCGDGNETRGTGTIVISCDTLSRWDLTSVALTRFFQDPAAAGLNVALRFFPDDHPAVGCDGYVTTPTPGFPPDAGVSPPLPNCDIDACSAPLVPAAPLSADPAPTDAQEASLVAAIQASTPPGPEAPNPEPATPTSAALGGAEQWAKAYRQAHPGEPTAVVLVTDGEPQGCDMSVDNIAALAHEANETAGVLTYVIGLSGSSEQSLTQIAAAGGTERAFFVSDGSTTVEDLLAALSAIRSGAR